MASSPHSELAANAIEAVLAEQRRSTNNPDRMGGLEFALTAFTPALTSLVEQLETLRAAATETLHEYDLWAEDANDGEFAIWSRDNFMASFIGLRRALNPASEPEWLPPTGPVTRAEIRMGNDLVVLGSDDAFRKWVGYYQESSQDK